MSGSLKAWAKLNLWLKITGLRSDGYHELNSLFVPVSLEDEIRVRESRADRVSFKSLKGQYLQIENDTVTKALGLFRKSIGPTPPLEWEVTKTIPVAAGLGGGSSDAAAALRYLAARYAPHVSRSELEQVALKVGADVPFFLQSKPALVGGVGEKLWPVEIEKLFFVIGQPPFGVSTKDAYGWYDQGAAQDCKLTRPDKLGTPGMINEVSDWPPPFQEKVISFREIIERMVNDFEIPVVARHPEIDVMKKALRKWGALGTLMSGTGSSVYGVFESLDASLSARESLQHEFPPQYAFFICETLA